jgi:hypothetical protein
MVNRTLGPPSRQEIDRHIRERALEVTTRQEMNECQGDILTHRNGLSWSWLLLRVDTLRQVRINKNPTASGRKVLKVRPEPDEFYEQCFMIKRRQRAKILQFVEHADIGDVLVYDQYIPFADIAMQNLRLRKDNIMP